MSRNACSIFIVGLVLIGCRSVACGNISRPNIIVIFTDDHGYTDLSCQGIVDDVKTPHIDAMAESVYRCTACRRLLTPSLR